jgi:hypothetical protein
MTDRPFWQRLIYKIFPAIKRVINVLFVLIMRLFRSVVKTIFDQV